MKHCFHFSAATVLLPIRHVAARLCVLCLLLVAGSAQAQTVFTVDGITYQTLTDSTVQVGDGMNSAIDPFASTVSVPSTVNYDGTDYSVTTIADRAFDGSFNLTSVALPASVTNIANRQFTGCYMLTTLSVDLENPVFSTVDGVLFNRTQTSLICYPTGRTDLSYTIPSGVTDIGDSAFYYSRGLTSVSFPESLTTINGYAFSGCTGLTSVSFPESLTTIGGDAFSGCDGLTSLSFPNSLTSIDGYAFYGCPGLTSVTLPKSLTSMGSCVFASCSSLSALNVDAANTAYSAVDGVLFNKDKTTLISFPQGKSGTPYTVPSGVTIIDSYAFYYCSGLTSVSFPTSLTNIRPFAFYYCSGLTSLSLPESLTTIDGYAFSGCSGLTSVSYPSTLTTIENYGFSGCSKLTSAILPNSLTNLGDSVFSGCSGLTSVSLPSTITNIRSGMFYNCSKLTSITLPASLTSIGSSAFYKCSLLASVSFLGTTQPTIASSSFSSGPAVRTLNIPNASSEFTASKWGASAVSYGLGNANASMTGPVGMQWKLAGVSGWNAPDTILKNIALRTYQVDFSEVAGWETPASVSVTVTGGGTATATGVYIEHSTPVSLSMMEAE